MATTAKAKTRPRVNPKTKSKKTTERKPKMVSTEASLESVFAEVVKIMKPYAPPFRTDVPCMSGEKKLFQLTVPRPVAIPGAYGGKPVDLALAAVILQKDFVGFYLMCIYMNEMEKSGVLRRQVEVLWSWRPASEGGPYKRKSRNLQDVRARRRIRRWRERRFGGFRDFR
jgi:hypothetical protein